MDANPKNQVVERLREAQNVLITVSNDPSVDQLAAAIGFTLLMNKLGKHATAVFSGSVPSTIEFLKPETTLEQNTDSLRDFIIALDKSKADKLRYKVEENVVRIFITPYKTSLSEADLDFSEGDFNVDVVVALGVDKQEHIDQAITAHGRILHDATVIGVMAGPNGIDLGSINWQDPAASSLCEMLVGISEAFQAGLLDTQMSTAFLTGIVAETERFSNDKTSPKVMTIAAQLMANGANQQLIATELTPPINTPTDNVPDVAPPIDEPPTEPTLLPAPTAVSPEPVTPPSEGVIPLRRHIDRPDSKPGDVPLSQISIDEQGTLHNHDEYDDSAANLNNVQTDEPLLDDQKPVNGSAGDNQSPVTTSQYLVDAPQDKTTFTASAETEPAESNIDPLSDILVTDDLETVASDINQPQDSYLIGTPSNESIGQIRNAQDLTMSQGESLNDSLASDTASTTTIDANQTKQGDLNNLSAIDQATQAVNQAIDADEANAAFPEPVQALNAQPFPDIDHADTAMIDTPPPLAPPLDFSQFSGLSADATNQSNPKSSSSTEPKGDNNLPTLPIPDQSV